MLGKDSYSTSAFSSYSPKFRSMELLATMERIAISILLLRTMNRFGVQTALVFQ